MQTFASTLAIGIGATALTDLWALARSRLYGTPLPEYALVGRWFAHMAAGTFRHERIAGAPPVRGERVIGWTMHYFVGIAFAALLPALFGASWIDAPTPGPAVLVGLGSVVAPFFVMQPGMGLGIAAQRTPRPAAARLRTLLTHLVFGIGLYATAVVIPLIPGV